MAASINGIGTRFYGAASPKPDGSVITTKWFAVIFIPIIPLSSYRVLRQIKGDKFLIFGYSSAYSIIQKLPMQWSQVFRTYAFAIVFFAWLAGSGLAFARMMEAWHPDAWIQWLYIIFVLPIPFYLLGATRARSYKVARSLQITEQGGVPNDR